MGFTGGISPIRTQPSPRPDPQVSNQPGPCQDKPGPGSDKPGPGSDKPGPGHDKVGPCKPDRATSNPRLLTSLETKIFPFEKNGSRKKKNFQNEPVFLLFKHINND